MARSTSAGDAIFTRFAPAALRNFRGVAAAVARNEDDHVAVIADEDERLHDLSELAANCCRGVLGRRSAVRELLDSGLGPRLAEVGRHAFDGLRPGLDHGRSLPPRPSRRAPGPGGLRAGR